MTGLNFELITNAEIQKLMLPPAKVANSANPRMEFTRQEVENETAQNRYTQTQ